MVDRVDELLRHAENRHGQGRPRHVAAAAERQVRLPGRPARSRVSGPTGIYTAPTDEALRYDIEVTKKLGMNMARKHVKVEPDRWYYWCDKLGLLVWQDMPSGDNKHCRRQETVRDASCGG